jgi:hypothetical protein
MLSKFNSDLEPSNVNRLLQFLTLETWQKINTCFFLDLPNAVENCKHTKFHKSFFQFSPSFLVIFFFNFHDLFFLFFSCSRPMSAQNFSNLRVKRELICKNEIYSKKVDRMDDFYHHEEEPVYIPEGHFADGKMVAKLKFAAGIIALLSAPFLFFQAILLPINLVFGVKLMGIGKSMLLGMLFYHLLSSKHNHGGHHHGGKFGSPARIDYPASLPLETTKENSIEESEESEGSWEESSDENNAEPLGDSIVVTKPIQVNNIDEDYDIDDLYKINPKNQKKLENKNNFKN